MDVIYHGGCVDGFTAAYLLWRIFPGATFHRGSYPSSSLDIDEGTTIIMVDFSYPKDIVCGLAEKAESILILDHHKTAHQNLIGLPENVHTVFDMDRCGASIVWDVMMGGERSNLVSYVEDADLWKWELPDSKAIGSYIRCVDMTFDEWARLDDDMTYNLDKIARTGGWILRRQEQIIKELLQYPQTFDIGGYIVEGVASPYSLGSEVAGRLAEDKEFGVYYVDRPDSRQFGLRSRDGGVDVSVIAEGYGGGGHEHASGFVVDKSHPLAKV